MNLEELLIYISTTMSTVPISVLAFLISCFSLWLTSKNWNESNRPIVCGYIQEESIKNGVALFNFHLSNTGNRPAVNIKINISNTEINKLLSLESSKKSRELLEELFDEKNIIPLLKNGETIDSGLGYSSEDGANDPQLKYGAEAKIHIKYKDLNGKNYKSTQTIRVFPRSGFNGAGTWE